LITAELNTKVLGNHKVKVNGDDLSFRNVPEYQRTKHVHRLHPYLGKYIPQLVSYFLIRYFKPGDIVLDPYLGSGTTLVEAQALGINSLGIEISEFNSLISEVKVAKYNTHLLEKEVFDILEKTKRFSKEIPPKNHIKFPIIESKILTTNSEYLKNWLSPRALQEILYYRSQIPEYKYQDLLKIILSRATRSARLITHYDLARPKKPVNVPYYCIKHRKTCEPVDEALKFIDRYSIDTVQRVKEYDRIRTDAKAKVIQGDSRIVKLPINLLGKIDGVFTSLLGSLLGDASLFNLGFDDKAHHYV